MASTIKVNTLTTQSGSTLTVGESGKTISLASGATATGFGRTGAVDWQTTKKTSDFTAATTEGYFVDTSSGAVTATLPSSPSAGAIVGFKDYTATFGTNNLTIARNGSNIQGAANNSVIKTNRASVIMVYVDSTEGWVFTLESNVGDLQDIRYVTATGGTITTSGDYKIHTFNSSGTFTVSCAGNTAGSNTVDYMVIAGGGGAGYRLGGGGGAGGFRESVPSPAAWTASPLANPGGALPVSAQGYPITIGAGGTGSGRQGDSTGTANSSGAASVFSTITSAGGGSGASFAPCGTNPKTAADGGSGGGGSGYSANSAQGAGNTPPVSPPQGNAGGYGAPNPNPASGGGNAGAGGGGAGAVGQSGSYPGQPSPENGGNGGNGVTTSITASPVSYAGGGGGSGSQQNTTNGSVPFGGGVGGDTPEPAADGAANKGGGGGATNDHSAGPNGGYPNENGSGGSGVVVIRYKYQN